MMMIFAVGFFFSLSPFPSFFLVISPSTERTVCPYGRLSRGLMGKGVSSATSLARLMRFVKVGFVKKEKSAPSN